MLHEDYGSTHFAGWPQRQTLREGVELVCAGEQLEREDSVANMDETELTIIPPGEALKPGECISIRDHYKNGWMPHRASTYRVMWHSQECRVSWWSVRANGINHYLPTWMRVT